MPVINEPKHSLRDRALLWADARLSERGHAELTFGMMAKDEAVLGTPPSLHKAFGSHAGFLAALAARQWERATEAVLAVQGGILELALADIAFAIDHPHRFRLMYEASLWSLVTAADYSGPEREHEALRQLEALRDRNYECFAKVLEPIAGEDGVRLIAALVTGLSFEFVNERHLSQSREEQLGHAAGLLRLALRGIEPRV